MGLVVQRLIEPQLAGVIYTGVNQDKLLVQYVDGFGASLVDGETHTLEEIGRKLGVTRERVRQVEAQALRRLRHPSRGRRLKDHLQS